MTDSHAIIAGANKAGTTSLFRYLAAYPEVCSSGIKETDFFLRCDTASRSDMWQKYDELFSSCARKERVKLEASPGYLTEGSDIARRIHRNILKRSDSHCHVR